MSFRQFTATEQRRMYVVLGASLLLTLGHAGADFLLPLWAVDVAGMRPSDWAVNYLPELSKSVKLNAYF